MGGRDIQFDRYSIEASAIEYHLVHPLRDRIRPNIGQNPMNSATTFIINTNACNGANEPWLERNRDAIRAIAGRGKVIMTRSGEEIAAAVRQATTARCAAVVGAGGDGTLNAIASHLIGTDVAFGVLPFGTLNHFAKDVGIPTDLDAALDILTSGNTIAVDVGEVNGRFFLNNSGLGLYPNLVRDRERQQKRLGRGKWPAFVWAAAGVLHRYPFLTVYITLNGQTNCHRTPFVFVGNNEYRMEGLEIGQRPTLTAGMLSLYTAQRTGRWGLLRFGLRALTGHLKQEKDFRAVLAKEILIKTHHRRIRLALDGEVFVLDTPLKYRIVTGALRVIVPPDTADKAA